MAANIYDHGPAHVELLQKTAEKLWQARHGGKQAVYADYARLAGVSIQTAKRRLAPWAKMQATPRVRRSDCGRSALSIADAQKISGLMVETKRKQTGKQLADISAAVEQLDRDGLINVRRVDPKTGEITRLSDGAISRAMTHYGCHPRQLSQPAPKVELRSEHPNHCWQIDPSICVLYYLKRDDGLHSMPYDQFYKNKPKNLTRIENDRVWRYVIVDHTTGAFYVEYVFGAESGENLCSTFINAMQPRGASDPFHGTPLMAMLDPGSANTGAMFKNLCAVLGVRVWINQPGQPWAKGSVEKHNDIIEREFEHRLKFYRVKSLPELNQAAWNWSAHFQSHAIHRRHGMTRFAAWQRIKPEQLRVPPAADVCRQMATHAPLERTVSSQLRVSFRGRQYDVRHVPGVVVRQKLLVARNAWADGETAHILGYDENRRPTAFIVQACDRGEYGFTSAAVPLGEHRAQPDTRADTHRKQVERAVMEAATDEEAAAKRKAGVLPFGGKIKPLQPADPNLTYLPRRGTPLQVDVTAVVDLTQPRVEWPQPKREFAAYTLVEAVRSIMPLLQSRGLEWTAAMWTDTEQRWPEGVPYDEIESWANELWQRHRMRLASVQEAAS